MLSAPVYIFRCFLHITYIWKLFSSLLWRYFYTTLGSTQFQIPFSKTHIFPPPCPPHRFLCSFVSLSTQHFTVQLLPPYGWASSYLTSPILVLSSSSLPYCGAINIFLHCKPSPYTLSDGGVFFLMACPLLDHTHSPWGVPSKKKKKNRVNVYLEWYFLFLYFTKMDWNQLQFVSNRHDMHSSELMLSSGDSIRYSLLHVTLELQVPTGLL